MEEDLENRLRDRTKEMIEKQTTKVEGVSEEKKKLEESALEESESKIPFSWDPREVEHLAENASSMSNDELERFMQKDSELHDKLEEVEEWRGFSRWEERLIIQRSSDDVEEVADQLGREKVEVEAKRIMMGVQPEEYGPRIGER